MRIRIETIRISNFRSLEEISLHLKDTSVLVLVQKDYVISRIH